MARYQNPELLSKEHAAVYYRDYRKRNPEKAKKYQCNGYVKQLLRHGIIDDHQAEELMRKVGAVFANA